LPIKLSPSQWESLSQQRRIGTSIPDLAKQYDLSPLYLKKRLQLSGVHIEVKESAKPRYNKPPKFPSNCLVLCDSHIPYHDAKFINKVLALAQAWKLPNLLLAGDVMDMAALSFFSHKPTETLTKELDTAESFFKIVGELFENILILMGNHERRFLHYLKEQLGMKYLLRLLDEKKAVISEYSYAFVEDWLVGHPRNASVIPGRIPFFLARKFPKYNVACLSEDTKVLTAHEGWLPFTSLYVGQKVATVHNGRMRHSPIEAIHVYDWEGNMVHLHNRAIDQLVTPNHRVACYTPTGKLTFRRADSMNPGRSFSLALAAKVIEKHRGDGKRLYLTEKQIRMAGWIITEGHFEKQGGGILVTQAIHSPFIDEIREALADYNYHEYQHLGGWFQWRIPKKEAQFFRQLLNSKKEIPRSLFYQPPKYLKVLFDVLMRGDGGHIDRKERASCVFTAPPSLGYQMLELCQRLGYAAWLKEDDYKLANGDSLCLIHILPDRNSRTIRGQNSPYQSITPEFYKGRVFCLTTRDGNFVAMRNGKPFITGNSGHGHLAGMAYCEDGERLAIDIGCSVDPKRLDWIAENLGTRPSLAQGALFLKKTDKGSVPIWVHPRTDFEATARMYGD